MALDIEALKEYVRNSSPTTVFYIGCDSERFREKGKWFADHAIAVVAHIDGCHGAKVFGEIRRMVDFDQKMNRPFNRMMQEAIFVTDTYLSLKDVLEDREYELHLDINPDVKWGSNCAHAAAVGYVKGMTGTTPKAKPHAWAASFAADRLSQLGVVNYHPKADRDPVTA